MVTNTTVRDEPTANPKVAPQWLLGVFEKVLSGQPAPRLAWFPAVMENLERLPWGVDTWSSESAQPLADGAVARLLFLLHNFLPPDGPAPAISPTWDGGVQADWELGNLYLELEVTPNGPTRCCFVDERGAPPVEAEFELDGNETALRMHLATIAAAATR